MTSGTPIASGNWYSIVWISENTSEHHTRKKPLSTVIGVPNGSMTDEMVNSGSSATWSTPNLFGPRTRSRIRLSTGTAKMNVMHGVAGNGSLPLSHVPTPPPVAVAGETTCHVELTATVWPNSTEVAWLSLVTPPVVTKENERLRRPVIAESRPSVIPAVRGFTPLVSEPAMDQTSWMSLSTRSRLGASLTS